jgi:hypothetical protein
MNIVVGEVAAVRVHGGLTENDMIRFIRFRKSGNGTAGGSVVRGIYYSFTTFEGENVKGYARIREFLPQRKVPPRPVNTVYNGI